MTIEFLNGEREFFVGNNEDCLFRIVREKLEMTQKIYWKSVLGIVKPK